MDVLTGNYNFNLGLYTFQIINITMHTLILFRMSKLGNKFY
jgi:hypothetical protein